MDEPEHVNLTQLPEEVIQGILIHLPASAVVRLEQTCRRFSDVTNEPSLWKTFCQNDFRWWNKRNEFKTKLQDPSFLDWKQLYAYRDRCSKNCRVAVQDLITDDKGRLDRIQSILEIGYDAKETLLAIFREAPSSEDYLAQRYWSHVALGTVQRYLALEEIVKISSKTDMENPYEQALAALDMFVLGEQEKGDVDDIFERLDSYATSVRESNPNIDELSPRSKACTIAQHLLQNNWIGIHDDRDYHSLDHMFLGVALFSENRNSIPIISALIFCYVARQFGLMAAPCSFPFHVFVLVQAPLGDDLDGNTYTANEIMLNPSSEIDPLIHLYMDPFRSSTPVTQSSLENQLRFIAPERSAALLQSYLAPATPRDITIRAAQNILASPSRYAGPTIHPISRPAATCAALYTLATLMAGSHRGVSFHQLRELFSLIVRQLVEHFEYDVHIFETFMQPLAMRVPHTGPSIEKIRDLRLLDLEPTRAKRRLTHETHPVQFKVGQVFRHRTRAYLAVIYGWDTECLMSEQWISMNQVNTLPKGKAQPFYNVLADDESLRYIAQENVILLSPDEMSKIAGPDGEGLISRFSLKIGKWFKRFDPATGTFISNIKSEFPDD